MEPRTQNGPILWKIKEMKIPTYSIEELHRKKPRIFSDDNIFGKSTKTVKGVDYDINRVSSRNARKSELGPYRNSFLREIISSHGMGKASGTKSELVTTILNYNEKKSK